MSMGKYRLLFRNTAILSIGTVLSKLITFFMVRLYTGVLTPTEYGTGDLLITTVSLLMPFVSFGISEGIFRFLPEYPKAKKSIFSIGIYAVTAGSVLLAALLPLLHLVEGFAAYLPLLGFLTVAASYHSVCEQYVRADGDTVLFAKQGLLNTLLVIVLNILFLMVFRMGITGYVLSVGLADSICTAYLVLGQRLWRIMTLHPNRRLLKNMLRYSIPLIPTTVFWWITSVSDRYMISSILGNDANGIYSVANKLPTMLSLLSGVLMQAWQYSAVKEARSSLREQARYYSNVWLALLSSLFLVCSAMIALAKIEIRILADVAYFEAWRYMPVLCAAMLFSAFTSFMGSVYTVKRRSGQSLGTSLLGAGVNIVLNLLLIPSQIGMEGAALATLASYVIVFLVRARNARRLIPFRLFKKELILCTGVLTVQVLFISFGWKGWQAVQVGACCTIFLIVRRQIIEKVRTFGRTTGRKTDA